MRLNRLVPLVFFSIVCLQAPSAHADSLETISLGTGHVVAPLTSITQAISVPLFLGLGVNFIWDATTTSALPGTFQFYCVPSNSAFCDFSFVGYSATYPRASGEPTFIFADGESDLVYVYADIFNPQVFPAPGSYIDDVYVNCSTPGNTCGVDGFNGSYAGGGSMTVVATPEPGTSSLLMTGLGLLGLIMVMRKRNSPGQQLAG
jgi:PEP-CTERM motif